MSEEKKRKIENIGFGGLKLIQDEEGFKFGVDAVILAHFACALRPQARSAVDLGTGNGIIPLIMSHKLPEALLTGIEVQKKAVDIARENARLNSLEGRLDFIHCDVNSIREEQPHLKGSADMVVTNPPYVERGGGIVNDLSSKHIARQETTAGIEDFISAAAWLLKDRGHMFMVHRPQRLVDIIYYCRKYGLEPKDIRPVCPQEGKKANIVLVHCALGGGHELNLMNNLNVYTDEGEYTREILDMYEKTG